MNNDINKCINEFLYNYINIRDIGWLKSTSSNTGEVGLFLETKLGKTGGDFCVPDYDLLEIKCINNKNNIVSLFSAAPYGRTPFPLKKIVQLYGWPDKVFKNFNKINIISEYNNPKRFGLKYNSFININNLKNIVLNIRKNNELLSDDVYWDVNELIEKIERKLKYLAIVTYYARKSNKEKYFKYGYVEFYKLKDNIDIISLFKRNIIKVKINYGLRKSGKYKGKYCDHGSTFLIEKKDLHYVFDRIK